MQRNVDFHVLHDLCVFYIDAAESECVPSSLNISLAAGVSAGGVLLLTIVLTAVVLVGVVVVVAVKRRNVLQHVATDGNCKHCAV